LVKIEHDLQTLVENCALCNANKNNLPKVKQHVWEPKDPMHRVHADFAGPFLGHWFFALVDAYSKWPEVHLFKNITAETVINKCREIFASYGVPQMFVKDNGKTFMKANTRINIFSYLGNFSFIIM